MPRKRRFALGSFVNRLDDDVRMASRIVEYVPFTSGAISIARPTSGRFVALL